MPAAHVGIDQFAHTVRPINPRVSVRLSRSTLSMWGRKGPRSQPGTST